MNRPRSQGNGRTLTPKPALLALSAVSPAEHTQAPFPAHLVTSGGPCAVAGAAGSLRRETGSAQCPAPFNRVTSKPGCPGRRFGFQRSSIKEVMGLGGGAGPSVLNYPECTGPGATGTASRLASCLPATPDSEPPTYLSCDSRLRADVRVQEARLSRAEMGVRRSGVS